MYCLCNIFSFVFLVLKGPVFISFITYMALCKKPTSRELWTHCVQIKITEYTVAASLLKIMYFCSLQVLAEECREAGGFLGVSPLFQVSENRQKLHHFISQYLYN